MGLLALFAGLYLHPNPYGNQPGIISDEAYFQSSILNGLAHGTLPGWEFSATGTHYGAVTTYLLLPILALVGIGAAVWTGSVGGAKAFMLAASGDLLQWTRFVNGVVFAAALLGLYALTLKYPSFRRRSRDVLLLIALLLGNSIVAALTQTGKVWVIIATIELLLAGLVVWKDDSLKQEGGRSARTGRYPEALVWLCIAAVSQNPAGLTTLVWPAYAVFLGHARLKDFYDVLRKRWAFILAVVALQASFIYRFIARIMPILLSDREKTFAVTAAGATDWGRQIQAPISMLYRSQPLVGYAFLAFAVIALWRLCAAKRFRTLDAVLSFHPLLILCIYHVAFRFGSVPRFLLPFFAAISISTAFLSKPRKLAYVLFVASWALAAAVSWKSVSLQWRPSSERQVVEFFAERPLGRQIVIENRTIRLRFPPNPESLEALDRAGILGNSMQQLRTMPEGRKYLEEFLPTVIPPQNGAWLLAPRSSATERWVVTDLCVERCRTEEAAEGACVAFNRNACDIEWDWVQEGATLRGLLSSERVGYPYFARRLPDDASTTPAH